MDIKAYPQGVRQDPDPQALLRRAVKAEKEVADLRAANSQFKNGQTAFFRLQEAIKALQAKEEECERLKAERQQDHERISTLEAEIETLRGDLDSAHATLARRRDTDAIVQNVNRSAYATSEKMLVPYIYQQLARSDEYAPEIKDGHVHICHATAAKALGINENTVGLALATLVQTGGATKRVERRSSLVKDKKTGLEVEVWHDAGFYKPVAEMLRQVHTLPKDALKIERKKRYTCQHCAEEGITVELKIKRVGVCPRCHHETAITDETPGLENLDVFKQEYLSYTPSSPGLKFVDPVAEPQNGDRDTPRCPHCGSQCVRDTHTIACQNCHKITVDETIHDEEGEQVTVAGQTLTPEPPDEAGDEAPTRHLAIVPRQPSDDEALRRAAELVQYSPCGMHLVMQPDGEKKYLHVHHDITQAEALAHFRGGPAVGFAQQKNLQYIRWLIFDVDNEEGAALLTRCAGQLSEAGYNPMLQTSPSVEHAGGLHLVILYSALVDARAAYEHACQTAPELRSVKEVWPFTHGMCAPGGFYQRPEARGWRELIALSTGDRARDGLSNARLLLANQTPAAIVPDLPSEPELPEPVSPPKPTPIRPTASLHGGMGGGHIPNLDPHEVIEAFNATYSLDDVHPREPGQTMARATWRKGGSEKVPSVQYNDSGIAYDYGENRALDAFGIAALVNFGGNWNGDQRACWSYWKKQLTGVILARRAQAS